MYKSFLQPRLKECETLNLQECKTQEQSMPVSKYWF